MPKRKDSHALSPALSLGSTQTDAPQLGGDAALTHIVAALGDPDPALRQRAVDALDALGGSDAVIDLLLNALDDTDVSVQQRAVRALGRIGGERVLTALLSALESVHKIAARGEILQALGRIGGERAYETLINFPDNWGSSPQHKDVKQAFRLMSQYHPDFLNARLAAMLPSDNITVCSKLVQVAGMAKPLGLVDPMMQFAADKSQGAQTRRTALRVLGAIGSIQASPLLVALMRDGEKDIIKWVADALAAVKDREAIPDLIPLLEHPNWQVRSWTAEILGKRKAAVAVPALIKLLADERKEVRGRAVRALGRIHTFPALMAVLPALDDPMVNVRNEASSALYGSVHVSEMIAELVRLLVDASGENRLRYAVILWRVAMHEPAAMIPHRETLRPLLTDSDPRLRRSIEGIMSLVNRLQ